MSRKLVLLTGAAAVALLVAGGAKADVITLTGTGTIDSGTDGLGLFGAVNGSLANDPFTMVMVFSTDEEVGFYTNAVEADLYAYATTSVTVNGQTFSFTTTPEGPDAYSQLAVTDSLSALGAGGSYCGGEGSGFIFPNQSIGSSPGNCDGLYGNSYTLDNSDKNNSSATLGVASFAEDFVGDSSIDQSIVHDIQSTDYVNFNFESCNDDNTVCTSFDDPLNVITLNASVPEPASLSLFGAALAWLGATRRRRRAA